MTFPPHVLVGRDHSEPAHAALGPAVACNDRRRRNKSTGSLQ